MEQRKDTFLDGRIQVCQEQSGYRFSLDAVILAYYARPHKNRRVLDLGTGCGIVSLIMVFRYPDITVYGVEIQSRLAAIAEKNVSLNRMTNRIRVLGMDMKDLSQNETGGPVDLIVTNPPYRSDHSGRKNPDRQRAMARHEIKITLDGVVAVARRMLKTRGKFQVIISAERLIDLISLMRQSSIEPKRVRMIHSKRGLNAKMVWIEGVMAAKRGVTVQPPLYVYQSDGTYTRRVERMFLPQAD